MSSDSCGSSRTALSVDEVAALVSKFSKIGFDEAVISIRAAMSAFSGSLQSLGVMFRRFDLLIYAMAEREYRVHVGKLPGSNRTSRLRKKRRKAVLLWFNDWIDDDSEESG